MATEVTTWDTLEEWKESIDFNAIRSETTYNITDGNGQVVYYYGCLSNMDWFLYETVGVATKLVYCGKLAGFLATVPVNVSKNFLEYVTTQYVKTLPVITESRSHWPGWRPEREVNGETKN